MDTAPISRVLTMTFSSAPGEIRKEAPASTAASASRTVSTVPAPIRILPEKRSVSAEIRRQLACSQSSRQWSKVHSSRRTPPA